MSAPVPRLLQEAVALEGAVARLQEENTRNQNAVQQIRQRESLIKQVRGGGGDGGALCVCIAMHA